MTLTSSPGTGRHRYRHRDPHDSAARRMGEALGPLFRGALPVRLRAWDGSVYGPEDAPTVVVNDPAALRRLLYAPGELGLAQAYVSGEIDVDGDLLDGLRRVWRAVRENGASPRLGAGTVASGLRPAYRLGALGRPPVAPASQARLRGRLHSQRRDRDAIAHHYDLSNDFYALILDPRMVYSCGYFTSDDPGYTLEDAQRDKLDLVCRKLGLTPGDRHLDIGCGWGSLSLHAAEHYGADVVAVTLSAEQRNYVRAQVRDRGLEDRVEVRLQDYRDVTDGPFDTVSSIEMGRERREAQLPGLHRADPPAAAPRGAGC